MRQWPKPAPCCGWIPSIVTGLDRFSREKLLENGVGEY
jgi:hypothetical protein